MKESKVESPVIEKEPEQEYETIVLDLPPSAGGGISHASRFYLSRVPYKVTPETARDLMEIQSRCKAHEASLQENENKNRRQQRAYVR